MLTDKEREYQARMARILQDKKRLEKNKSLVARSGDVPCYLSSMTEDKKAEKGFYYCPTSSRINHLKDEVRQAKNKKQVIIRITK